MSNTNYNDIASIMTDIRKAAPREDLHSWMIAHPARVYRDLIISWVCIIAALVALSFVHHWWMYLTAFLVIGASQYALFIQGHDAIHGSLHPITKINDRLAKWFIHGPMFMGFDDGKRNHLEHHRTLGTEADPDRYLHVLSNKNSKTGFLLFCSGLATFGKTVLKVTPFGKMLDSASQQKQKLAREDQESTSILRVLLVYIRQRVPVIVAQILILSLFLGLRLPFWSYFVLWVAPIYFCVFLADEIRAFCDHAVPAMSDVQADPYRLITFRPMWLEALFLSPRNMNYHAEHHLWPGIPYYNLP